MAAASSSMLTSFSGPPYKECPLRLPSHRPPSLVTYHGLPPLGPQTFTASAATDSAHHLPQSPGVRLHDSPMGTPWRPGVMTPTLPAPTAIAAAHDIDILCAANVHRLRTAATLRELNAILDAARGALHALPRHVNARAHRCSAVDGLRHAAVDTLATLPPEHIVLPDLGTFAARLESLDGEISVSCQTHLRAYLLRCIAAALHGAADSAALEAVCADVQGMLGEMGLGLAEAGDPLVCRGTMMGLWDRLLAMAPALSIAEIDAWTDASADICLEAPCPQVAVLTWLQVLCSQVEIDAAQCAHAIGRLGEMWAPAGAALENNPALEPAAIAALHAWFALWPQQLRAISHAAILRLHADFQHLLETRGGRPHGGQQASRTRERAYSRQPRLFTAGRADYSPRGLSLPDWGDAAGGVAVLCAGSNDSADSNDGIDSDHSNNTTSTTSTSGSSAGGVPLPPHA
jgi:hypothetical protein